MKKLLLTSCLALGLTSGLFADTITPLGAIGGAATGSNRLNFNSVAPLTVSLQGVDAQVSIKGSGGAAAVTGSSAGQYAAPFLSLLNGNGFGDAPGAHQDATRYLSTGIGSITFSFASPQNYFGLLWGSVDDYNSLDFYLGGVWMGGITGLDITALAIGDQGATGTYYVNIIDSGWFDEVVASSTQYAFEIDNVAYNAFSVPDSGATVALLGLSLACLVFFRRKAA